MFLKQVHPDVLPSELVKERKINTEFVKFLNDYMHDHSDLDTGRTLQYYYKSRDRVIPRRHTFMPTDKESCLRRLFQSKADAGLTQKKHSQNITPKTTLFGCLLQDHYKRKHK